MFADWRSAIASPSADWTWGLLVSSPRGVWTGSLASNGTLNGDGSAPFACAQKRRKSRAPRESRFSCRAHLASTSHALPTSTGPEDEGAVPPKPLHRLLRDFATCLQAKLAEDRPADA